MGTTWRSSDDTKWTVWGGEWKKCGHRQAQIGVVHWERSSGIKVMNTKFLGCHEHLLSFCLVSTTVSVLSDLNYFILKKIKNTTQEKRISVFFTLNSLHSPSHPPYIGWRIFSSLFGTCLLYRFRVRCCGVEEKNVNTCHLLTFYICIFVFWFLK